MLKKERNVLRSFAKERNVIAFFAEECCVLCVLLRSLQKNVAYFTFFSVCFSYVLLGLISRQKLKKRTEKNAVPNPDCL